MPTLLRKQEAVREPQLLVATLRRTPATAHTRTRHLQHPATLVTHATAISVLAVVMASVVHATLTWIPQLALAILQHLTAHSRRVTTVSLVAEHRAHTWKICLTTMVPVLGKDSECTPFDLRRKTRNGLFRHVCIAAFIKRAQEVFLGFMHGICTCSLRRVKTRTGAQYSEDLIIR